MTEKSNSEEVAVGNDQQFPVAKVRNQSASLFRASKMWWITLLCLLLASWLTYSSLPENGPTITISFPQGHGLKPGDAVQYRGIEVGLVSNVRLSANLSQVDVEVILNSGEGRLAHQGSRFWIVRPRLSLTEIQGLETAVGAKYIGVSPGDINAEQTSTFEGLAVAPADELNRGGLQVVLRSDNKHGISAGAAVTWRGVNAGRVLSVNLSPDARHVHTTILVDRNYRKLVNSSSKFWVNSGFAVDVGLSGIKLNAASLSSVLNGGVSFSTMSETKQADSIRNGHVFSLVKTPEPAWLQTQAAVPLVDFQFPETVLVTAEYQSSLFGISRTKSESQQGILAENGQKTVLVTARFSAEAMKSESAVITVVPPGNKAVKLAAISLYAISGNDVATENGFTMIPIEAPATIRLADIQPLQAPEDCLLFRSAVIDGKATPLMQTVDLEHVVFKSSGWILQDDKTDFSEWLGAPVFGTSSGQIVGILAIIDGQARIATPE